MSQFQWPAEVVDKAKRAPISGDYRLNVLSAIGPDIEALVDALEYVVNYPDHPDYMATDDDRLRWSGVHALMDRWRQEKP